MSENNDIFLTDAVSAEQKGLRLDKFLSSAGTGISRAQLQRLILQGYVSCDDDIISDNSFKVREGDVYQIILPEPEEALPEAENIALDIVYEDNDLIVVNKPAGMTVHPGAGTHNGTLVNALLYHCRDNLSGIGGVKRPGIVHRIDKETSGLLVVAKNDLAHQGLSEQFARHSIERTYFAFVYGVPNPMNGTVAANIGRSPYDRKKMAILPSGGKEAVTHYQTLKISGRTAALIKCNLETGRTHQIRVHMASLGCNLIGDKVYVKNKKSSILFTDNSVKDFINAFPRQALHAASLGFEHPRSKKWLQFNTILPDDLQKLAEVLGLN